MISSKSQKANLNQIYNLESARTVIKKSKLKAEVEKFKTNEIMKNCK